MTRSHTMYDVQQSRIDIRLQQLKLHQLRAFVAISDLGNFGEAALQLQLTQSALSHSIAALEETLGVQVLIRGRHGATITPIGESLLPHARQVLLSIERFVQEADYGKGLNGGGLRLAAFRSVATHVLPTLIAQFRQTFPNIKVAISEYAHATCVEQALREGQADIGFTVLPTNEDCETWSVVQDEYLALLPPNTTLAARSLSWEQLSTFSLISCLANSCHFPVYRHLEKFIVPLKFAYDVLESSTMVSMVAQGLGAGVLARLSAEPIPAEVQVYPLPVPLERWIVAAVPRKALWTPAMTAFLDQLKLLVAPRRHS